MVNLYYASDEMEKLHHRWPFVYLHGEAEDMNLPVFAANEGAPPDICVADVPLDEASPDVVHNFCLRHPSSF